MLTERENRIKNVLLEHLGGSAAQVGAARARHDLDDDYLRLANRRMAVNRRRMWIFTVLYFFVLLTAVAVMLTTVGDYNVLLWVVVGTFNAVNAAIHYAEYQKKRMAFAALDALGGPDNGED